MSSRMSEDSVIRKRLAIEGDSGQDDKRIAGLLKTLLKWCAADNLSQEENEATYQKIMFTLTQVKFALSRTDQVVSMNQLEEERYERLGTQVQIDIKQVHQSIIRLKEELIEARQVRQHRQEYDAMATIIQKHPDRSSLESDIKSLEDNSKNINDRIAELSKQLELRQKQSSVLVLAIQQLMDTIDKDDGVPMET